MRFLKERILQILRTLSGYRYEKIQNIEQYKLMRTDTRVEDVSQVDTSRWPIWKPAQLWGGHREFFLFETVVTIPPAFDGHIVGFQVKTGCEDQWDTTNPQFSLFINGKQVQGCDVNHTQAILTDNAQAGETFRIILSAFSGDNNLHLLLESQIYTLDPLAEALYFDLKVPLETASLLEPDSDDSITIITSLNQAINLLDFREPFSDTYRQSLQATHTFLQDEFYGKICGKQQTMKKLICVGHTHIDVAWLWTIAVTKDKVVRSFSTVLELMRRYPEYIFLSSQPQLYQYMKEHSPTLYEEIKQRVAEGRWETEGGMWVEADCNLSSGESLVRQFIHGKRFFREEFGTDNEILWLPDVFGYSAALPQIMEQCGIRYFMTTKISWNELNQMPYDTFEWEGIDGTRILTHFIPARDYIGPNGHKRGPNSYENSYFTTYNGILNPSQVMGGWERYQQKALGNEALFAFGYGDGGGGATSEMLEYGRRMAKGIPGCPQTVMGTAKQFFHQLEKDVAGHQNLPRWVGELYLEYHRGTYTSMARNKRDNRKSEFAYQNIELWSSMHQRLCGGPYPANMLDEAWKTILLNQFHDILPGSSIEEVYEDSQADYTRILTQADRIATETRQQLADQVNAPVGSLVVFNPNAQATTHAIVTTVMETPAGTTQVLFDGETAHTVQSLADGQLLFQATDVPAKGFKTFELREGSVPEDPSNEITVTTTGMENQFFLLALDEKGQFARLYDKRAQRELFLPDQPGNQLICYEDRPHNYDAWDINHYYTEKSWFVEAVTSIIVEEQGPLRAVIRIERPYLKSTIVQRVIFYRDLPRIDLYHEIDWKEEHQLLKLQLPLDLHTSQATYEIQYGNVTRPTHQNTSWDQARFEVVMHKWMDLSEGDFGVSILSDAKYGVGVQGSTVGLTLLKSATSPNPSADRERHHFTYALYPHLGGWQTAGTIEQAYLLNNPLAVARKQQEGGTLPSTYSFVTSHHDNVVVEVVKQAEESTDLIVRVYECHNRRTNATLSFGQKIQHAWECNLLEQEDRPLPVSDHTLTFPIKPYEIKTLKLSL